MGGAEGGVGECFYSFVVEELASWFSVSVWKTAKEWEGLGPSVDRTLDDACSCFFEPAPDTLNTPRFWGICLG